MAPACLREDDVLGRKTVTVDGVRGWQGGGGIPRRDCFFVLHQEEGDRNAKMLCCYAVGPSQGDVDRKVRSVQVKATFTILFVC